MISKESKFVPIKLPIVCPSYDARSFSKTVMLDFNNQISNKDNPHLPMIKIEKRRQPNIEMY